MSIAVATILVLILFQIFFTDVKTTNVVLYPHFLHFGMGKIGKCGEEEFIMVTDIDMKIMSLWIENIYIYFLDF